MLYQLPKTIMSEEKQAPGLKTMPEVSFDKGRLRIQGWSLLDDASEFYDPIIQQLQDYSKTPDGNISMEFELEMVNCSTNKSIMSMLHIGEDLHRTGRDVRVTWKYNAEDEVMFDHGQLFKSISKVPFDLEENR